MNIIRLKSLLCGLIAAATLAPLPAFSYLLLANQDQSLSNPQKWGPHTWGTGATITWSFMTDGVTSNISGYNGPNTLSQFRTNIDNVYGTGAFNNAVSNAFATWAAAANLTFVQITDSGGNLGGATSPDIRIGAFDFDPACCTGGAGYGPPGDSAFPDALAGDLVLNNLSNYQIYPYAEGQPYQVTDFANDLQGLLVHEIGHTLGLGHPEDDGLQGDENDAIMCVLTTCDAWLNLRRELGSDDIAAIQYIYGSPVPLPGSFWLLASGLVFVIRKRSKNYPV
jgi:hypothetical protein